jgi:hypothetical protein
MYKKCKKKNLAKFLAKSEETLIFQKMDELELRDWLKEATNLSKVSFFSHGDQNFTKLKRQKPQNFGPQFSKFFKNAFRKKINFGTYHFGYLPWVRI